MWFDEQTVRGVAIYVIVGNVLFMIIYQIGYSKLDFTFSKENVFENKMNVGCDCWVSVSHIKFHHVVDCVRIVMKNQSEDTLACQPRVDICLLQY